MSYIHINTCYALYSSNYNEIIFWYVVFVLVSFFEIFFPPLVIKSSISSLHHSALLSLCYFIIPTAAFLRIEIQRATFVMVRNWPKYATVLLW